MRGAFDRAAARLARGLLAWTTGRAGPARREWLAALAAELDAIEGGAAQLAWAAGALRLLWAARGRTMEHEGRIWPGAAPICGLGIAFGVVAVGLTLGPWPWSRMPDTLPPLGLVLGIPLLYLAIVGLWAGRRTGRVAAGATVGAIIGAIGIGGPALVLALAYGILPRGPGGTAPALGALLVIGALGAVCGTAGALVGAQLRYARR